MHIRTLHVKYEIQIANSDSRICFWRTKKPRKAHAKMSLNIHKYECCVSTERILGFNKALKRILSWSKNN